MLDSMKITMMTTIALGMLVGALFGGSSAVDCPISSCASTDPLLPIVWFNTSNQRVEVRGLRVTSYPMQANGEISQEHSFSSHITTLTERVPSNGACGSQYSVAPLLTMNLTALCCNVSMEYDYVGENVRRTSVVVALTDPDFDQFRFYLKASVANSSYQLSTEDSIYDGERDETFGDDLRLDTEIFNWPWASLNSTLNPLNKTTIVVILADMETFSSTTDVPMWMNTTVNSFSRTFSFATPYAILNTSFSLLSTIDGIVKGNLSSASASARFSVPQGRFLLPAFNHRICPYPTTDWTWTNFSHFNRWSGYKYTNCGPQPSPEFVCRNGAWISDNATLPSTLVIPSGASTTIINANVSSSSVVFQGLGSTISVNGCANNLTTITVELSAKDLSSIPAQGLSQNLIRLSSSDSSCSDLKNVTIVTIPRGSSCKRVNAQKSVSNGQLSALFTVNSSDCNTWWIILVSVLCGLLLLAVIVIFLVVRFVPSAKRFVHPFTNSKRAKSAQA